jgi:hypothetical protein
MFNPILMIFPVVECGAAPTWSRWQMDFWIDELPNLQFQFDNP